MTTDLQKRVSNSETDFIREFLADTGGEDAFFLTNNMELQKEIDWTELNLDQMVNTALPCSSQTHYDLVLLPEIDTILHREKAAGNAEDQAALKRQRVRESARKCRKKKKAMLESMLAEAEQLEVSIAKAKLEQEQLRDELQHAKVELNFVSSLTTNIQPQTYVVQSWQ